MIEKSIILSELKKVKDPELDRDILSLGMVKEIQIQDADIRIDLSLTSTSEALQQLLKTQILEKLKSISGVGKVDIQITRSRSGVPFAKLPLPGIQNVIAVASGKGGVGKTTVSVNLAAALSKLGFKVGLMDGDIYGPNVPLMLGVREDVRPEVSENQKLIPIQAHGIRMISMGVLVPADQPMVWRGPMLHGAVTQFLQKVEWGQLDYLLVDLPPGTGDVQLSLVQSVPLTGAVMVTMPQEVSLMDVRKGILMFQKTQVPILGVIENMSGEIFGQGGGEKAAAQYHAPFLGRIPLDAQVRQGGDRGKPIALSSPDHPVSKGFFQIAESLVEILNAVPK